VNMHLLSPLIDDKRGEPKMTPRLTTPVKQVAELHDTSLQVCHSPRNLPSDGFTPLAVGRNWLLNARG
jgi:hypothetical protein